MILIKPTTYTVLEVELSFKCKSEEFENIYQKHYKNIITHEFIRSKLGLSDNVRLKLNGTFKRGPHPFRIQLPNISIRLGIQGAG